jgi:hypothetical protein
VHSGESVVATNGAGVGDGDGAGVWAALLAAARAIQITKARQITNLRATMFWATVNWAMLLRLTSILVLNCFDLEQLKKNYDPRNHTKGH